jgi:hypothetical protein
VAQEIPRKRPRILIHAEVQKLGFADPVLATAVPLIRDQNEPSRDDTACSVIVDWIYGVDCGPRDGGGSRNWRTDGQLGA